jgi:hypothetical protein
VWFLLLGPLPRRGGRTLNLDDRMGIPLVRLCGVLALWLITAEAVAQPVVLDDRRHHLGVRGQPEWEEFADDPAEGPQLELTFRAGENARDATLFLRQRGVKLDWGVLLNGRRLGSLFLMEEPLVHALAIPAGALREGENRLTLAPPKVPDDIVVDEVALDMRPREEALSLSSLGIDVADADSGRPLPCRVTIVDDRGALAPLWTRPDPRLALRPGVVYSADGRARVGVLPGRYTVFATRGFEYGLDSRAIEVAAGRNEQARLVLRREVPTEGLVACDTHIHTLTHSGHGDATIEERVVTLAGEGIELPIATEHNLQIDYRTVAERMGLLTYFTPVVGNEVTTRVGHFNAFPFPPGGAVPDARLAEWPRLMEAIRSAPGERAVVLNHPRDLHAGFRPFDPANFNAVTGEMREEFPIGFDAVEAINSGAMQTDPMRPFRDWMALWNHGDRITAVGASDSHDVSRFLVGQGRT